MKRTILILGALSVLLASPWLVRWAVSMRASYREQRLRQEILAATELPLHQLRKLFADLDGLGHLDGEFQRALIAKVFESDLRTELGMRFYPSWIDVMEMFREDLLVSEEEWARFAEKILAYAEAGDSGKDAVEQLIRYEKRGWLTSALSKRLLATALAVHGGDDHFVPEIVEYLVAAQREGRLAAEGWQRYLRQCYEVAVRVRKRVREGKPLPLQVEFDLRHCLPHETMGFRGRLERVEVDGSLLPLETSDEIQFDRKFLISTEEFARGEHRITVSLEFEVAPPNDSTLAPHEWTFEETSTFTIVPVTTDTVELVSETGYELEPDSFFKDVEISTWTSETHDVVRFGTRVLFPPIAFSYDVYWKTPEEEVLLGSVFLPATSGSVGSRRNVVTWEELPENLDVPTVDLVLRPNLEPAEEDADCHEIWGKEMVLARVPVAKIAPPAWFVRDLEN